jgi:DNA mismatch repair ATPase MutS
VAHPLLAEDRVVRNNVRLGDGLRVLIVSGSNMSGKSTLLRAVGLNVVLAQAGGPVSAAGMRLSPVRLWTSMRVQDSLEEGVSYFMAALKRLKEIVDAARPASHGSSSDSVLLYLLDEILAGTNTAERQIAVRRVLCHLVASNAIGAVTTHDLALAEIEGLAGRADAVHFTESISGVGDLETLTFDYRLRPGVATSRNALKLMRMIGLTE